MYESAEPGAYHWIKSEITEDADRWEIAFIDDQSRVWIFGISGWFPRGEIAEIGPRIERPKFDTKEA